MEAHGTPDFQKRGSFPEDSAIDDLRSSPDLMSRLVSNNKEY